MLALLATCPASISTQPCLVNEVHQKVYQGHPCRLVADHWHTDIHLSQAAITLGFAMGALAKLGMSFATSVGQLFVGKAVDRLANGVQAAPRDALIGDLSPIATRSACFGFAQSMRKWGSFMGAGLAFALMKVSGNNYRLIFLLAAGGCRGLVWKRNTNAVKRWRCCCMARHAAV